MYITYVVITFTKTFYSANRRLEMAFLYMSINLPDTERLSYPLLKYICKIQKKYLPLIFIERYLDNYMYLTFYFDPSIDEALYSQSVWWNYPLIHKFPRLHHIVYYITTTHDG